MTQGRRMLLRIWALAYKETLHVTRDPRTLYLTLGMPVVLLLLFGFGISFDIDKIPVAFVDLDLSAQSRQLERVFFEPGELVLGRRVPSSEEAEGLLQRGEVLGVLTIPRGTGADLTRRSPVTLPLAVDGADGVVANQLLAKADAFARAATMKLAAESGLTMAPPVQVSVWTRFNPEGRSTMFLVPGLAAFLLAIAAVLLTALTVAAEWERGSMEQLFASPVGRLEIVLGKLLPYLAVGMMQLLLVLAAGAWVFDVPIRGSVPVLFLAGLLFLIGMLGQGLLISVVTRNQLVATQAGALSSLLPSMLLSGFVIPIENMPQVLQWFTRVIPARYLVHTLRGVMLKGTGFRELWPDLVALTVFGFFVLALATKKFKRRIA